MIHQNLIQQIQEKEEIKGAKTGKSKHIQKYMNILWTKWKYLKCMTVIIFIRITTNPYIITRSISI